MGHAAILLSRQPLRPSANCPWVQQTLQAVRWLKANSHLLCSSAGVPTWNLITAAASMEQAPLKLLLPTEEQDFPSLRNDIFRDFDLRADLVEFVPLFHAPQLLRGIKEQWLAGRDERVVSDAQLIIPICIRPDGHMQRLIEEAGHSGKEIITTFQVPYPKRSPRLAYTVSTQQLNANLSALGNEYLVHWTRARSGPWPDEREIDYWRDIVASSEFPRSALATLRRIVASRRLIASTQHMPGNISCVSFTGLTPLETLPLMRWRARYSQMSFEPYGIGLRKSVVEGLTIRAVEYYDRTETRQPSGDLAWLWQSRGIRSDWRQEKEFRYRGDLQFGDVSPSDLILFCHTQSEARALESEFGIHTIPFVIE